MSNFVEIKDKDNALLGHLPVSKEGGRLRNIVYMTESGVYEKPAWLKFVIVKGVGGGGGGGGCAATSETKTAMASGGGGGGYFEKKIAASELSASETVTIGLGGNGASAGANAGNVGGATSFGSHCSATGGGAGAAGVAMETAAHGGAVGGAGGVATGGDININGRKAPLGRTYKGVRVVFGDGEASFLGSSTAQSTEANGVDATSFGSGGSGPFNNISQATAWAGGNGAPGICIIEEYE